MFVPIRARSLGSDKGDPLLSNSYSNSNSYFLHKPPRTPIEDYRNNLEILQFLFQTTIIKSILQQGNLHDFFFTSAHKNYVYAVLQSIKCAIVLCIKTMYML